MSAEVNFWYVKLPDGDVHRITLEQLDAAFQSGRIDESTMVLAAGSDQWAKLGDLLGGDDEVPDDTVVADAASRGVVREAPMRVPTAAVPVAPAVSAYAAPRAAGPMPPVVSSARAGAPPLVVAGPPAYVPYATSLRPMSVDLGDAADIEYPKPRKIRRVLGTIGALLAIGAVGFAVQRTALSSESSAPTMAAAAALPPPAPAPEPTPAPVAPEVSNAQHLPDDLKTKLLEADKQRDAKSKVRKSHAGGEAHAAGPKYKSSPVFTTGGNKYDPLNSNL